MVKVQKVLKHIKNQTVNKLLHFTIYKFLKVVYKKQFFRDKLIFSFYKELIYQEDIDEFHNWINKKLNDQNLD